ncbi:MAG: N-acetyltransferase [Saprospiraceae bacterium]|nr:N-acetyltransferase [Saprospiraceae bacterium]
MKQGKLTKSGLTWRSWHSLDACASLWESLEGLPVAISYDYLSAIECRPPDKMSFIYVVLFKEERPLGLAYFQLVDFSAAKSLKLPQDKSCNSFFSAFVQTTKKMLAAHISFKALINGNLLSSGPHGFYFLPEVPCRDREEIMMEMIDQLFIEEKVLKEVSVCLLKDLPASKRFQVQRTLRKFKFFEFQIQPGMRFFVREDWNEFSDYLDELESKYRLRIKKTLEKSKDLSIRKVQAQELHKWNSVLYEMYLEILDNAGFNMVKLHPNYFIEFKSKLQDAGEVIVFFEDELPIGFCSYLLNGDEMLAHFVGYRKQKNAGYQIYSNILLVLIQEAIRLKLNSIDFARTALEIKSSVGAQSEQLYCYISHHSKIYNHFIPMLLQCLQPENEWVERSPFKKGKSPLKVPQV